MKVLDDLLQYPSIVFGFERDLEADSAHPGKALSQHVRYISVSTYRGERVNHVFGDQAWHLGPFLLH